MTSVAIVGAGPTGLALALGLARHGVRSVLIEKGEGTSGTSKAPALHVRTREVLRQWGVEPRFLAAGELWREVTLHNVERPGQPFLSVDFADLIGEAERPGLLVLEQSETERLLLEAIRETGLCDVRFGAEAIGLEQDADGVHLTCRHEDGLQHVRASYLVGCDGASSFVRGALGLPFDGLTYSVRPMLADVRIPDGRDAQFQPRVALDVDGLRFTVRLRPGLWRLVRLQHSEPPGEEVTQEELRREVDVLLGAGPFELQWASRFRIHVRSSPRFRVDRVLLAGDAAHVHSPASGFGMNGGIQDAHNLAWKLAHALRGGDADRLLDSYEIERRAVVVEETSRYTDRITRLFIEAPLFIRRGVWRLTRAMMRSVRLRRRYLRRTAMLDLDYPASPLLREGLRASGLRLPDPLVFAPGGTAVRLYELLPNAPVLIDVARDRAFDASPPLDHVIRIGRGGWTEPAGVLRDLLGGSDGWLLVRPDAHIAWALRSRSRLEAAIRDALGVSRLQPATPRRRPGARRVPQR